MSSPTDIDYPFDRLYRRGGGFLSPSGRLLFVNIPKNASTSFQRLLLPLGFRYTTAFRDTPVPTGLRVLSVVREPLSRWRSALLEYAKSPAQTAPFETFAQDLRDRLRAGTYRPLDPHLTPQTTFLLPTMGVTDWLRFEFLDADYAAVADELGLPPRVRHHNRAVSARAQYLKELLTPEDERAVRDFYANDVLLHSKVQAMWAAVH